MIEELIDSRVSMIRSRLFCRGSRVSPSMIGNANLDRGDGNHHGEEELRYAEKACPTRNDRLLDRRGGRGRLRRRPFQTWIGSRLNPNRKYRLKMSLIKAVAVLTAICCASLHFPAQAGEAQGMEVHYQVVYARGDGGGYHTYRIPAVVVTSKGTILAPNGFCGPFR